MSLRFWELSPYTGRIPQSFALAIKFGLGIKRKFF